MAFVVLTRPDGSAVAINIVEIVHLAPVPTAGPLQGPLTQGTRIVFRNQTHQDVKELLDEVVAKIKAAQSEPSTLASAKKTMMSRKTRKPR